MNNESSDHMFCGAGYSASMMCHPVLRQNANGEVNSEGNNHESILCHFLSVIASRLVL
jgi:hypothetical protein